MLREEGEVNTHKYNAKVNFCSGAVEGVACKQRESVYEGSYDGKYGSY